MTRSRGLTAGLAATALLLMLGSVGSAQEAAKRPAAGATTASACKGLPEAACKIQGAACAWISPKTGKQKPYCRAKAVKSKK